jgi:O-antigen ligase
MALLLALLMALIPLAIAPGLLFYFDVTPKTILLLLGTAAAAVWWAAAGGRPQALARTSRAACWFTLVLLGIAASLAVSTLTSVNPALSVGGSNWRNWGLVTQVAVVALAYLVADRCAGRPDRVRAILRALTASGLIAAIYGAAQYFGWDPLLDAKAYHVGEGIWTIVRPPSTLGHADYFGIWLLCAVFAGAALVLTETVRVWKRLAAASVVVGTAAIFLSGTRSAMIGLLAGAMFLAVWRGLRFTRAAVVTAVLVAAVAAVFYLSPAGARLRARVHWALQDPVGGARILLWRDSLRMAASRWALGYGPETFIGSFARRQSIELARAYPDFYHESAHNIFLDALVAQGAPGPLLLGAFCAVGFAAAWTVHRDRSKSAERDVAGALAASLAAMTVSGQFASFMLPTALAYYVVGAMLAALTCRTALQPLPAARRWPAVAAVLPFAGLLAVFGVRLLMAERALAEVRRDLDESRVADAANQYSRFERWHLPGAGADLWYSRKLAQVADSRADLMTRIQAAQQCARAAERAPGTAEDPFNAYYNLAELHARQNDIAGTERNLRAAISQAPNWFKPHWMLAQVLEAAGRPREAEAEAARALLLDGGKHAEVARTLEQNRKQAASNK